MQQSRQSSLTITTIYSLSRPTFFHNPVSYLYSVLSSTIIKQLLLNTNNQRYAHLSIMSSAHSIDPTQDHFDECKFMRSLELSYSEGSYQTTGDDLLDSIMFGPCSTPLIERNVSEQSGTGTGSTRSSKTSQWTKGTDDDTFKVSHGGKTYPDVKRKDLERSILSRRMNRLVPSHEYDLFRQQQRKDTEGIKKTIRSLAGQADWPQFRKQCKDLVDAVENNTELGSDLKTLLKNELRGE